MVDFGQFRNSIGVVAEISAIYYNALVNTGLSEDVAITLTVKLIHEITQLALDRTEDKDGAE